MSGDDVLVVPAVVNDAEALAQIHASSFPRPWSADDFALFLQQDSVLGWVAGTDAEASAFILFNRAAEEAEIMTIAVLPQQRRKGLAAQMLTHALEKLRRRGTAACYLEVDVDNTAARALYAAAGFVACGMRRGYYERPGEKPGDAVLMRRDL